MTKERKLAIKMWQEIVKNLNTLCGGANGNK